MKIKSRNSRMGLEKLLIKLKNSQKVIARVLFLGVFMSASTAFAAGIDNTVTASGTAPGGVAGAITATASENVDVEDAAPDLEVLLTSSSSGVAVGGVMTYTYTIENTGNTTLTGLSLSDAHDGLGLGVTPVLSGTPLEDNGTSGDSTDDGLDATWDTLAPNDIITWTASYTVVQADLNNNGGGDGDIDSTVTASATAAAGTLTGPFDDSIGVTLQTQNPSLSVSKTADDDTDVTVGQLITYTYVVENNGNVPITDVSLADNVTAGSGAAPVPALVVSPLEDNGTLGDSSDDGLDNTYDTLGINDKITFTGTYTVTQSDVDTLQ